VVEVLVDKLRIAISQLALRADGTGLHTSLEAFAMSEKAGGGSLTMTFSRGSTAKVAMMNV
jgi:hypothetical protein